MTSGDTSTPRLLIRRWAPAPDAAPGEPVFVPDSEALVGDLSGCCVVIPKAGPARIHVLLGMGATQVFVGEAALTDSAVVKTLVREFGAGRIGIYVSVRRMPVSWAMDCESNADFRVMTPSVCEPSWEVLLADGSGTGTHAAWWIGAMFDLGASAALIRTDLDEQADQNICATLTEKYPDRLWFTPSFNLSPNFAEWVEYAGVSRMVVSGEIYRNDPWIVAALGRPEGNAEAA